MEERVKSLMQSGSEVEVETTRGTNRLGRIFGYDHLGLVVGATLDSAILCPWTNVVTVRKRSNNQKA